MFINDSKYFHHAVDQFKTQTTNSAAIQLIGINVCGKQRHEYFSGNTYLVNPSA